MRAAASGDPAAIEAATAAAEALGRGIGALVNALDPAIVTLGGLGADLIDVAGKPLAAAARRGAMTWRRGSMPPIVAAAFGSDGPAIGAAETALAAVFNTPGLVP
jgi:predicted NBD/HSP70 family sugar kinase